MAEQSFETYLRLEPRNRRDLNRGFRAEIGDPVWFLGQQWLMGEHQGENASSPVRVDYAVRSTQITRRYQPNEQSPSPQIVPPEAIVEAERNQWWTLGRRIRIGAKIADAHQLASDDKLSEDASLKLQNPAPPYENFEGEWDGLQLWLQRNRLNLSVANFEAVMPPNTDSSAWQLEAQISWNPAELVYSTAFDAGDKELTMPRHLGGSVDWYSVDAVAAGSEQPSQPAPDISTHYAIPVALEYPGAPADRWWTIEDAKVNIGGYAPDRSRFVTAMLIDLIMSHSTDWFLFPVPAEIGQVVDLANVVVTDAFDKTYTINAPQDWSLFKVMGLSPTSVILWNTAITPMRGGVVEHVQFGTDDYSNLLWAVERRVNGRDIRTPATATSDGLRSDDNLATATIDASATKAYQYLPGKNVTPYWHPYQVNDVMVGGRQRRRFVQGILADISVNPPVLMPEPQARMLYDDYAQYVADNALATPPTTPPHTIEPATIPIGGMELKRNWMLTRDINGNPVIWVQRRRMPLSAPPSNRMRFDVLDEKAILVDETGN